MKKIAIILLLLSTAARAGWQNVGKDDATTTYADPASIVRKGNVATMRSLLDYRDFQRMVEVGYFSRKVEAEYDCTAPRVRGLSLALHAEKMGEGKVIYEDSSPHEWEAVEAGSLNDMLRNIACK